MHMKVAHGVPDNRVSKQETALKPFTCPVESGRDIEQFPQAPEPGADGVTAAK